MSWNLKSFAAIGGLALWSAAAMSARAGDGEMASAEAPMATAPADAESSAATATTENVPPPPASAPAQQAVGDAWFTGPLLTSGAGTLPQGRWLFEPYLLDIRSKNGDTLRSLTYVLYGVTDRFTVGAIPVFSYNRPDNARNSSHIGVGDVTLTAQYRLTQFKKGSWVPTTALVLREIVPTGKHDRLNGRGSDGFGGGAFGTQVELRGQTYSWMPNGRILRTRLNTQVTLSQSTKVRDDSVYGTPVGFRGRAKPGSALAVNLAFEYSLAQRWVLATDFVYRHDEPTKVWGVGSNGAPIRFDNGVHDSFQVAPAVEYSWSQNAGVVVGLRVIPAMAGRRGSVTPAIALNYVY